ncbi:hypothetical protein Tco_0663185 [Tanacetum coccineum]
MHDIYRYLTKEAIWLKGLMAKSGAGLKLVAVVATGALIKAVPGSRTETQPIFLQEAAVGIFRKGRKPDEAMPRKGKRPTGS